MATSKADLIADECVARASVAVKAAVPKDPKAGDSIDIAGLAAACIADVLHWCDARGLSSDDVLLAAQDVYRHNLAGRPEPEEQDDE